MTDGVTTGATLSFISAFLYGLAILLIVSMNFPPSPPDWAGLINMLFLMAAYMYGIAMIPSMLIGITIGVVTALLLAIPKARLNDYLAATVGLMIGASVLLVVNYLIWSQGYMVQNRNITFLEYFIPIDVDFLSIMLGQSPFLVPSLIAAVLSAVGAYRINKRGIPLEDAA